MEIPNKVRIQGQLLEVHQSPRGSVSVGQTTKFMDEAKKNQISQMSYNQHITPWKQAMYRVFIEAYNEEKRRIKEKQ